MSAVRVYPQDPQGQKWVKTRKDPEVQGIGSYLSNESFDLCAGAEPTSLPRGSLSVEELQLIYLSRNNTLSII